MPQSSQSPSAVAFSHFTNLYGALQDYCNQAAMVRLGGLVKTEIGKKVLDSLDYAEHQKSLVLIEGHARMGKSFMTKAWCEACPVSGATSRPLEYGDGKAKSESEVNLCRFLKLNLFHDKHVRKIELIIGRQQNLFPLSS